MHSPASVRVLSVSDYESVRLTRELLLQNAGYSVVSMSSDCAMRDQIPGGLAIAIVGQTVDEVSASRLAVRLRRTQPNIRILRLTMQYSRSGPDFDGYCFVEDGPAAFLTCLAELVAPEKVDEFHLRPVLVLV